MPRILLIGYRQGLVSAMQRRGLNFAVWSGKPLLGQDRDFPLLEMNLPTSYAELKAIIPEISHLGQFDLIIAGSEKAVPIVAALNRLWKLPSCPAMSYLRCHDKLLMKRYLAAHGIPMTPFLSHQPQLNADDLLQKLGRPVVCKERAESGGRELKFCETREELAPLLGKSKLYERFIAAPELSIESFRQDGRTLFTNFTQYYQKQHINVVPALISQEQATELLAFNERILELLGIPNGMTHLEVYLSKAGPVFGEIAWRPPGGYIMDLLSIAYGFPAWDHLLAIFLGETPPFPQAPKRWAAAHIFHPGSGTLRNIRGWKKFTQDPSCMKAKLKVAKGDSIDVRLGTGQDVAYLLQAAENPDELKAAIGRVQDSVHFDLQL